MSTKKKTKAASPKRGATAKRPTNHGHPGNPQLRNFNSGMRPGLPDRPSPTMVSAGAGSTPLIRGMPRASDAYARMLDEVLPQLAPDPCGMRLAEFFCCAGGIGLGFRSAGFELAFANDISPKAAASYARNLGHEPVVRDIRGVGRGDYGGLGEVDVVTGGFPCVTFSTAGRRMGVVDDLNGKLYQELCRVIQEIRPRYFVAENVEGMLSANGGKAVKIVLAEFLRMGYRTTYELVNMAEHGVPQTRKRVIFVGVRLDQWRGSFSFPKKTHRLREDKKASPLLPIAVSLAEAIGDLPPPGERIVGIDKHAGDFNSTRRSFRSGDRPAGTIVSNQARTNRSTQMLVTSHARNDAPVSETTSSGAPEASMSDGTLRRMTVRECARVQSFPDWYRFAGTQGDGYTVVGNAVPPLYARRLALAIRDYDAREIIR